ncbi:hypothetical protein VR010_14940 [Actinomycetaceae bacterium L2_0104]
MLPGPSEKALTQGVVVGARISVMRGGVVLATDVPATDIQLDITADRVVPEQLTYLAPSSWIPEHAYSPLNSFGQRSHLSIIQEIDGQQFITKRGWFTHGSASARGWEETTGGVKITAYGLLQLVEDNPAAWPSSPPRWGTVSSELQRLSDMPIILEGTDGKPPRTAQWGTSRTEAIRDLCESFGLDYAVKPDGYLHAWPRRDILREPPVARYTDGLVLDAPRSGVPRRANRIVAVGSGENEQRYTTTVESTAPPYDRAGYGLITERIELSGTTNLGRVREAANARQRMLTISTRVRSVEIVLDPRLEIGDVITVVTSAGEHITGRVVALSMTVRKGEGMRVDVEEFV